MFKWTCAGNPLVVQWLGLSAFTAVAQVQSVVGERIPRKLHGVAKTKQNKQTKKGDLYSSNPCCSRVNCITSSVKKNSL